jgi:hypothetical protein
MDWGLGSSPGLWNSAELLPRIGDGEGDVSSVLYECPHKEGRITAQVWLGCLDGLVEGDCERYEGWFTIS